jgi:hypothetical protein
MVLGLTLPSPRLIDQAMHCHSPEPMQHLFPGRKRCKASVQIQEHILRYLLSQRGVVNNALRNAEHHRLVLAHQRTKAFKQSLLLPTGDTATAPELNCDLHSAIRAGKRVCSLSRMPANII